LNEFVSLLRSRGFLETEEYYSLQERRHAEFRACPERGPIHAGGAYPDDVHHLREAFDPHFAESVGKDDGAGRTLGLAAPHVSPEGGWDCYAAAYQRLDSSLSDKTFVILGTSHYGMPDKFGLTRKTFVTPLGKTRVDEASVDLLARKAPGAVEVEDYCHAIEHSIEFQVVFLQYRLGAPVRILPILCGPFFQGLENRKPPESIESLKAFFDGLAELADEQGDKLFWLLGIDLAHIGQRYGDPVSVEAGEGPMRDVEVQDRERLDRVCEADSSGLFEAVKPWSDPMKWCGFSPLYAFLYSLGQVRCLRGRVLRYQQWNIDPQSVVSFAGLEFFERK
jgi:AmmeMemoRadiSam system protein B